jgi:predicted acetyltransferase
VPVSVGAVGGVAVLPEFRRNGVAAKMMEFAIVRMLAEGHTLSVLFPFSHEYYSRFGYRTVSDLHAYRIKRDNLVGFEEDHTVRPFEPEDLPMLRVVYKGQMTWHNGWFTRSNQWWDRVIERWPQLVVVDNDGMLEGYCAYEIKTSSQDANVLHIREFFAATAAAYRGLVGYFAAQNEVDVIEYLAPPDTPLRHTLRQPIAQGAQNWGWIFNELCYVTPGPVARIINLPRALTTRFYTRGLSGERVLQVTDPLIPTNEEPLIFRVVDGRPETHAANGRQPQIKTDIGTLSQILCGYLSADDAYFLGRFDADKDTCSWLNQIIADSPLYIQAGDWF